MSIAPTADRRTRVEMVRELFQRFILVASSDPHFTPSMLARFRQRQKADGMLSTIRNCLRAGHPIYWTWQYPWEADMVGVSDEVVTVETRATDCRPGSRERIEVYAERYAMGRDLHHEDDAHCLERDSGVDGVREYALGTLGARHKWIGDV